MLISVMIDSSNFTIIILRRYAVEMRSAIALAIVIGKPARF